MRQADDHRRVGRGRVAAIIGLCILIVAAAGVSYAFYRHQRSKNDAKLLSQAKSAQTEHDWALAASSYRLYLQRNPDDSDTLVDYARTLVAWLEAKPDVVRRSPQIVGDIIRTLRTLVRQDPRQSEFTTRHLVRLYLLRGEFTAAEVQAEAWVRLNPQDAEAAVSLARAHIGLHRNREAAVVLSEIVERIPDAFDAYALLIDLYDDSEQIQDRGEAQRWLDVALKAGATSDEVQLAAFRFYHRRIDGTGTPEDARLAKEAAEQHLDNALALAGEDVRVLVSAAHYYLTTNDLNRAGSLLEKAHQLAPTRHLVLQARAAWAIATASPDLMTAMADEVLAAAGVSDPPLTALAAELYLRAGAFPQADECLEALGQTSLGDRRVQLWLDVLTGAQKVYQGHSYRAIPYLERAMRVRPSHLWTAELLAKAYVAIGADEAAVEVCRGVLLGNEDAAELRLILAQIELGRGHDEAAKREALLVVATNTDASKRASLIVTACELRADDDASSSGVPASALASLQRRVAAEPADGPAVELLATWYAEHGRFADAMGLLRANANPATTERLAERVGALLLARNDRGAAHELANWLVSHRPSAAAGHVLHIKVLAAEERFDEAITYAEQSSLQGVAAASLWLSLGESLHEAGRMASSLSALRRAVDGETDHIPAMIALIRRTPDLTEGQSLVKRLRQAEGEDGRQWRYEEARFLLERSRTAASAERAADLLTEVLSVRRTWLSARVLLAFAYENSSKLDEAADAYRAAIELSPELASDELALRLVRVLRQLGRFVEADRTLAMLAEGTGSTPEVLRLQTESYLRQQNPVAAAATAEQLLALRTDDPVWAAATAELHVRAGNAVRAEEIARASLAAHEDSTTALWSLSRALVAQHRSREAEELVVSTAAARHSAHHYVVLAQLYRQLDKTDEADAAIGQAAAMGEETAAISAACAHYWQMRGDRAKQVYFTRKTVEQRGEDPAESLALAGLLARGTARDERAECEAIIARRLKSHPDELKSLLLKGQMAATATPPDFEEATVTLRKALSIDPRSASAHKLLAAVQMRTDKMVEATETVAIGLTFAPTDVELLLAAGEIHCHRGLHAQAIPYLRRLLDLSPHDSRALVLLATAFRRTGRLADAVALVEGQSDGIDMTGAESALLAELYEAGGDLQKAESIFESALARDGTDADVFSRFLQFKARRGAFEAIQSLAEARRADLPADISSRIEAGAILGSRCPDPSLRKIGLDWLDEIIRTQPEHAADAAFKAALCHYAHREFTQTEPLLKKAAELAPARPRPVNTLAWMYCEDLNQPERALDTIDAYLARGGVEDDALLDTHGTVLMRLGRLSPARQKFVRCVARSGQGTTLTAATYHLGQALLKDGDAREGRRYLRQALQLNEKLGGLSTDDETAASKLLGQ